MLLLTISTDNAAFDGEERPYETARILRDVASSIREGATEGTARDTNGNTCARFAFVEGAPDPAEVLALLRELRAEVFDWQEAMCGEREGLDDLCAKIDRALSGTGEITPRQIAELRGYTVEAVTGGFRFTYPNGQRRSVTLFASEALAWRNAADLIQNDSACYLTEAETAALAAYDAQA